ncbi:MAG: hypothetical protein HUJ75_04565, partial [Parasporobacterium sp.]|nr:hypothetical protein [Parasporobacterium sp.]
YERPAYLAEGIATENYRMPFTNIEAKVPRPEYPISIKENFKRAYTRNNPVWVPCSMTDMVNTMVAMLTGQGEADWSRKDRYDWNDWFGVEWTYIPEAGGPMLKPGTKFLDDITNWETGVKFPNLNDYDIEGLCKKFMAEKYNPEKITHVNIGQGCTERLVALLGGYTDALVTLVEEPEAVKDFLEAFVDFTIGLFDKLTEYVPIDMITYHDDWGTERDTFFSPKMMEEIVFDPTKRLFDHFKSKDVCIELHSCGKIERFVPYMIDLGVDFMQIQARANDMKMLKEKYGDKIGFNIMIMPEDDSDEALDKAIHEAIDTFGKGGGMYSAIMAKGPEKVWHAAMEHYYYGREFYEK